MNKVQIVPIERIEKKIFLIRGEKVMLDRDLSGLYGVETKVLKQAVKRNIERFPEDFMFQLTWEEAKVLRSQFVTLKNELGNDGHREMSKRGQHIKYLPSAFTEQGIAMLSSVLNSKRAISVNIQIMRTFTNLRKILATHRDLRRKLDELESKYDQQFKVVFDAIKALMFEPVKKNKKIGFLADRGDCGAPKNVL